MKILVVTSVHPPYDIRIYHKQFKSLKKYYNDIKIIIPNQVELARTDNDFISFKGFRRFWFRSLNNFIVIKKCFFLKPSLIIFHDPDLLPFMLLYKIFSRTAIVYDIHEDYPSYFLQHKRLSPFSRRLAAKVYLSLERLGRRYFQHLIYADHFTAEFYNGKLDGKITSIYNYPFIKKFAKQEKTYDIVYPGYLHSGVHQLLLKILEELDKRLENEITLLIISRNASDDIKNDIVSIAQKLHNVKIVFKENLPFNDTQEYIEKSKIGVIPWTFSEKHDKNIPTKMFEYLIHSLPQVASKTTSISHYLSQTESGFCIDKENYIEKFADKILEILKNYSLYQEKAEKDSELIEKKWNWDKIEEKKFQNFVMELEKKTKIDSFNENI